MNAYELADDLDNSNGLQYITKVGLVSLSSNMLRQQAEKINNMEIWEKKYLDRIAEYEKSTDYWMKLCQESNAKISELEKEIKRLIGAEPITYGMLTFCKNCGQQDPYSPQTKPLSDEEIDAVVNELRQKANDPERWVTMLSVAVETILDLRDRLNTKPLSDEEIKDLWFDINKSAISRIERDMQIIFARAIEERILGK